MSKSVLLLIVGVVVGALGSKLLTNEPTELPEVKDGDGQVVDASKMDLPQAIAEIKKLQAENQTLKARQSNRPKRMVTLSPQQEGNQVGDASANQERPGNEEGENRREGIESRIFRMMESRIQDRINNLKSVARMSDDQSKVVEAFLRERGELQMEYRRLRFSGELTDEQEAEFTEKLQEMSVSNFLKDNLSEEQYSEYDQYLQVKNQTELESYALRQLSNLIEVVQLTDDQRDQARQAFYQEAYTSIPEGEEFSARRRMFGPEAIDNMESQLIALDGILNEEQMTTYRTQVETRIETFQSGGGRPRGSGGR